jgi:hypothetical protein
LQPPPGGGSRGGLTDERNETATPAEPDRGDRALEHPPPWRAIALWLAFVLAAVGVLLMTGSKTLQNGTVGEAARGYSMLENHQLQRGRELDYGYVHSDSLRVGDPAFRAAIADVRAGMRQRIGAVLA